MGTRNGEVKEPFVLLDRDPIIESRVLQGENVVRLNSTCFVCGRYSDGQIRQRRCYKEQTNLFKGLLMNAQVRRRMSPKAFNQFSKNIGSCAGCVGTIKEVWDLSQEINHIQKELDKLLVKARERLTAKCDVDPYDRSLGRRTRNASTRKYTPPRIIRTPPRSNDNNDTGVLLEVIKEEICSIDDADLYANEMSPYHYMDIDMDEIPAAPTHFADVQCSVTSPTKDPLSNITSPIRRSERNPLKLWEISPIKMKMDEDENSDEHDTYEENIEDSDYEYDDQSEPKGENKVQRKKYKQHNESEPRKFKCSKCLKPMSRLQNLISHEVLVCNIDYDKDDLKRMKIKFHECDQCNRRFPYKSGLDKHILTHKDKPTAIKPSSSCPNCGISSRSEVNKLCRKCKVNKIVNKMDSSVDHTDRLVEDSEVPKSEGNLEVEENGDRQKPSKPNVYHPCSKCGKVLKRFHSRIFHEISICKVQYDDDELKRMKVRFHQCGMCEQQFLYPKDLVRHSRTHSASQEFPCDKCGKSFREPLYLQRHQRLRCRGTEHDDESKTLLQEGTVVHSVQGKVKCPKCPKTFVNRPRLVAHLANHPQLGDTIVCDICGKLISTVNGQSSLLRHIRRIHGKILRFHCSYCGKGFFDATDHRRHLKTHERDKSLKVPRAKYACETCGKMVTNMYRHNKNVHQKIRRFECQICHYKFFEKHDLNRHEITHNNPKYSCSKCRRGYKSLTHLEKHQKRMPNCDKLRVRTQKRNVELINCLHCKEVLQGKYRIRLHMEHVHPEHVVDGNQTDVDNSQPDEPELAQNTTSSDLNQNVEVMEVGVMPQFYQL